MVASKKKKIEEVAGEPMSKARERVSHVVEAWGSNVLGRAYKYTRRASFQAGAHCNATPVQLGAYSRRAVSRPAINSAETIGKTTRAPATTGGGGGSPATMCNDYWESSRMIKGMKSMPLTVLGVHDVHRLILPDDLEEGYGDWVPPELAAQSEPIDKDAACFDKINIGSCRLVLRLFRDEGGAWRCRRN